MFKKIFYAIAFMVVLFLLSGLNIALADEYTIVDSNSGMSPDQLLWGYIDNQLLNNNFNLFLNAKDRLSNNEKVFFDVMEENIKKIASGEQSSTVIRISNSDLSRTNYKISWTEEELGITKREEFDNSVKNKITTEFFSQINLTNVHAAILSDMPYDLYWYDKTIGIRFGVGFQIAHVQEEIKKVIISSVSFSMAVNEEYRPENYTSSSPEVSLEKTGAVKNAVSNAQYIVEKYKNFSDYEKLKMYADDICRLTSYNHDAVSDADTPYGNPWELIHVFDGNPDTNVVCEGYSKAFKYLCDMSEFENDIDCILVSGAAFTYDKPESASDHMWNIVTVNNVSYLVDITNSDNESIGQDGELFLAGCRGYGSFYGIPVKNKIICYAYDNNTVNLWGSESDSILRMSNTGYNPGVSIEKINIDGRYDNKLTVEMEYNGDKIKSIIISVNNKDDDVDLMVFKCIYDNIKGYTLDGFDNLGDFKGAAVINIEDYSENGRVFIWDSNLMPIITPVG